MSQAIPQALVYFGKLPSRGDFVRSTKSPPLIQTLDRWLSTGVEALAEDPRWKTLYDQAAPAHFAFLGTGRNIGLAGHLIASNDASGRRFPFITAVALEVAAPLPYLARCPLLLARVWSRLEAAARQAYGATDAAPVLGAMAQTTVETESSVDAYQANFRDFLEMHTVGALDAMLAAAQHPMSVRRLVLGLGLLLGPVLASGETRLEKGLLLPLPADPLYRPLVASLWLELVSGFLARADFELTLFLPRRGEGLPPTLALGFQGASAQVLRALFDPALEDEVYVDARKADWVEDYLGQDYAVHKLSTYLQQEGLSLQQAVDTFKEVFLGS